MTNGLNFPPLPPQPPTLGGLGLLSLFKPEIKGMYFYDKEITLDGYVYIECAFHKCKLTANTTNFSIQNCLIDEHSIVYFSHELVKVIQLYNRTRNDLNVPFVPIKDKDGRISIT